MKSRPTIDVASAAARRRFFIDRARRKNTRGSGSDMTALMELRGSATLGVDRMLETVFGGVPVFLVGAYAAAAYAPERMTTDVDYFTVGERFTQAEAQLVAGGCKRTRILVFPNAKLGLFGSAWSPGDGGREIDLIASDAPWAHAAFAAPRSHDRHGRRVIPLAFLVLMKLDSARGVDQGDLNRILGRLSQQEVENVVAVVEHYYDDPAAEDDIRQSAEIGRWEYETAAPSDSVAARDQANRDFAGRNLPDGR